MTFASVALAVKIQHLAREQLDKLFIFGISLPQLDHGQQEDYLRKLIQIKKDTDGKETSSSTPISTNRYKNSIVATDSSELPKAFDDNQIYDLMVKHLSDKDTMTPRQLRILYYRLLFANNVLAAMDGRFTENAVAQIIQLSITGKHEEIDNDIALSDAVKMVVSY